MSEAPSFTQSACVLLSEPLSPEALSAALRRFNLLGPKERAPGEDGWVFGGDGVLLSCEPELRGVILVDVVARPWPEASALRAPALPEASALRAPALPDADGPGDVLAAAWRGGYFGPLATPGGLERAVEQSWAWEGAAEAVHGHQAFLRVRCASGDTTGSDGATPEASTPLLELLLVTEVARALLDLPGALAYFNPNGEALREPAAVAEGLKAFNEEGVPPLDLWANLRLHLHPRAGWSLMDTIGMAQLDVPDHEACFSSEAYLLEDVDRFLRNATYAHLTRRVAPAPRTRQAGPGGGDWSCSYRPALVPPERPVIRWLPEDGRAVPAGIAE